MTKILSIFLGIIFTQICYAQNRASDSFRFRIAPIIGYETVYRDTPVEHKTSRLIYGVFLTLGKDALAGELEYTRGSDTETYNTAPQTIQNADDKAKLGLRSTYWLNNYLFTVIRGGLQVIRNVRDITSDGIVTHTDKTSYYPYAGISLGLDLETFTIGFGTVMIFKDARDFSKNDVENMITLGIRF